ncbi:hypothetical protein IFM89_026749, partial [Coptis chinensis]
MEFKFRLLSIGLGHLQPRSPSRNVVALDIYSFVTSLAPEVVVKSAVLAPLFCITTLTKLDISSNSIQEFEQDIVNGYQGAEGSLNVELGFVVPFTTVIEDFLKSKSQEGVRVLLLIWDDPTYFKKHLGFGFIIVPELHCLRKISWTTKE